jgi:ATP-dependent RNA helicase DHX29
VHERSVQGDFLVMLLREIVAERRNIGVPLKIVLMSATIDTKLFSDYFQQCPVSIAEGQ